MAEKHIKKPQPTKIKQNKTTTNPTKQNKQKPQTYNNNRKKKKKEDCQLAYMETEEIKRQNILIYSCIGRYLLVAQNWAELTASLYLSVRAVVKAV